MRAGTLIRWARRLAVVALPSSRRGPGRGVGIHRPHRHLRRQVTGLPDPRGDLDRGGQVVTARRDHHQVRSAAGDRLPGRRR